MKFTIIHGQTHKGSTYHITQLLLSHFPDCEQEEYLVNSIPCCIGCFQCIFKGEQLCPHRKEIDPILQSIEESDILIIDSPTYCFNMTGQLKTFFDHMGYRWLPHRPHPSMRKKIGIAISTTAGAGSGNTTKAIKQQLFWWGIPSIYRISFAVGASSWKEVSDKKKAKITQQVNTVAKKVAKWSGKERQDIRYRLFFELMRNAQKKATWNPVDRQHWVDNGWIK